MRPRAWPCLVTLPFTALLIGCNDSAPRPGRAPTLAVLTDLDPDPDVVEVELVAAPARIEILEGTTAEVWAFRDGADPTAVGSMPGPMLEAKIGDRVIVHFRNELPEETTLHWHGLRVPNAADGTPVAQVPVPPGGSYDYEMTLVDEGLYWYHPHMHGDVQIERGLYAPIRVHGAGAPIVSADRVFVLDDVKLEASGALSSYTDTLDLMLGRQGNVVVVNGVPDARVEAGAGSRERWRFVNTANGRYFNLELPGQRLLVIGSDGGPVNQPYEVDRLLISPGERYEVLVTLPPSVGATATLRTVHYDRGHDIPDPGPIDLVTFVIGPPVPHLDAPPPRSGHIEPIAATAATPRRRFVLGEDDSDPRNPVFMINDEVYPDVTAVASTTGAVEVWEIDNQSEMDHPFHLHGMSFQVLGPDGAPVTPLAWKDTVNVPREQALAFAVRVGAPGRWMFHCHILEHAERGMMGELQVAAP